MYSERDVRPVHNTQVLPSLLADSPSCTCCRSIVKDDLFGPVITVFLANGPRYNMLNSSKRFHCLASCQFTKQCDDFPCPPFPFLLFVGQLPTLFSQISQTPTFKHCQCDLWWLISRLPTKHLSANPVCFAWHNIERLYTATAVRPCDECTVLQGSVKLKSSI